MSVSTQEMTYARREIELLRQRLLSLHFRMDETLGDEEAPTVAGTIVGKYMAAFEAVDHAVNILLDAMDVLEMH